MNKYFRFLRMNVDKIYRTLLFLLTITVITMLFPNVGYFRYEFQKGKPWKHETLIAPFDFAIHKTDQEIATETDSLLDNYKPYFRYDPTVLKKIEDPFQQNFQHHWQQFKLTSSFSNMKLSPQQQQELYDKSFKNIMDLFSEVYQKGIVELTPTLQTKDKKPITSIKRLKNNVAEEFLIQDLYVPKTAYQYISQKLKETITTPELTPFLQELNLNSYLYTNLYYDEDMSENVKKSLTTSVSITRGMVQAGERIVLEGDIIDNNTFRILESIKKEYESILGSSQSHYLILLGQLLLVTVCLVFLYLFLRNFRPNILNDRKKLFFILFMIVLLVAFATFILKFPIVHLYIVPFALITIVLRTFMDSRTALFTFLITILLIGSHAPNSFEFTFLQLGAGMVSIFVLTRLERRGQLILTAFMVFATYSLIYFAFAITQESSISEIKLSNFRWFAINGILLTLSYPLIYILEKGFGFLSDVTLIELSHPNHPLLRKLTQNSPGTFQHSLQVANLAEEAIHEIGGNPLLVRTGALYHDIGKMKHPVFFIENQTSDINPHDKLEFDKSAQIITDHVKYGIEIAKKHKIPQQIIDFIRTHHGSGKVQYFYRSFKNKYPEREIDEEKFSYPGPDPFTRETAVLMMADSVEAASRSLKIKSAETIQQLVYDIIDCQVNEHRFDNADITFKNITQVKEIFTRKLLNVYHVRIEYPEENKK